MQRVKTYAQSSDLGCGKQSTFGFCTGGVSKAIAATQLSRLWEEKVLSGHKPLLTTPVCDA